MNNLVQEISQIISDSKVYRIVFLGDSITSTEWVHPNWREIIEYVLKEELQKRIGDWQTPSWNVRCINSGLDGSTSDDILTKLDDHVFYYKPDLVIWLVGSNDQLFKFGGQKHQKNTQAIVDRLAKKVDFVVFSSDSTRLNDQANNVYESDYLPALEKVRVAENVGYVDLFRKYREFDLARFFTFKSEGNEVAGMIKGSIDFAHPNQLGNAYIAKVFLKDIFDIDFDPEKYIEDIGKGAMYPGY